MDSDETLEPTDKPHEVVTEPIEEPPVPVPDPPAEDEIPAWGKSLIEKVDGLAAQVAAPVQEGLPQDLPRDESPEKLPWTHRPLFG